MCLVVSSAMCNGCVMLYLVLCIVSNAVSSAMKRNVSNLVLMVYRVVRSAECLVLCLMLRLVFSVVLFVVLCLMLCIMMYAVLSRAWWSIPRAQSHMLSSMLCVWCVCLMLCIAMGLVIHITIAISRHVHSIRQMHKLHNTSYTIQVKHRYTSVFMDSSVYCI